MNKPKKPNAVYNYLTKDSGKHSKDLVVFLIIFLILLTPIFYLVYVAIQLEQHWTGGFGG